MKGWQGHDAYKGGRKRAAETTQLEIHMIKTFILPAVMAIALIAGGAAFAAAPAPVTAPAGGKTIQSREQINEIRKHCAEAHRGDKAGYKTCVQEKAKETTATVK